MRKLNQMYSLCATVHVIVGPVGLIHLADDECVCPEGNSRSFVNKLLLTAAEDLVQQQPQDSDPCKTAHDPTTAVVGIGKEPSFVGAFAGAASSGASSSAWPVLNEPQKSKEPCFHIKHFMGERGEMAVAWSRSRPVQNICLVMRWNRGYCGLFHA